MKFSFMEAQQYSARRRSNSGSEVHSNLTILLQVVVPQTAPLSPITINAGNRKDCKLSEQKSLREGFNFHFYFYAEKFD